MRNTSFARASIVIVAIWLSLAMFCASAAAEGDGAVKTLSLRTKDGLVVADCSPSKAEALADKLSALADPPSTNREAFRWLLVNEISADAIRVYLEKSADAGAGGARGMKWIATDLGTAERTGLIPSISGLELYEAYMLLRSAGYAVYLDAAKVKRDDRGFDLDHTVFALSSAFMNGYHGIYVDGKDYSKGAQGYNIVAFEPDGSRVADSAGFSLFANPGDGQKMAAFINSFPEGTYIISSINIGPGVFLSGEAIQALQSCGSTEAPDPEVLSSHAMIGKKGTAPGGALENSAVNAGSNAIYFNRNLFVDATNPSALSLDTTGRAVILSGSGPGDSIQIHIEK